MIVLYAGNEELIHLQEFALNGSVMQVELEVFLYSNTTCCQLYACFCFNGQFQCSSYKQHNLITMIKLVCANLEWNVLSHYIMQRKTSWFHCHRPDLRCSTTYTASSVNASSTDRLKTASVPYLQLSPHRLEYYCQPGQVCRVCDYTAGSSAKPCLRPTHNYSSADL